MQWSPSGSVLDLGLCVWNEAADQRDERQRRSSSRSGLAHVALGDSVGEITEIREAEALPFFVIEGIDRKAHVGLLKLVDVSDLLA